MRIHAPNITGSLAISGSLVLNNGDAEFNSAEFSGNVSGSATSTGSFGQVIGEGHNLTNLQRPITTHISNFTASMTYAGHYNVVHGQLTCSILAEATASVAIGTEFEFFQ